MSVERGATARCNEYDGSFLCGAAVDMVHLSPVTFQVALDTVDPSSVNIQVNPPPFIHWFLLPGGGLPVFPYNLFGLVLGSFMCAHAEERSHWLERAVPAVQRRESRQAGE